MDFGWSDIQQELYERFLAFARERLNSTVLERDAAHQFGKKEWALCAEAGLAGLCISEEYGGSGLDALTTARVIEALGRGCEDHGLIFSLSAHLFAAAMPILEDGPEPLRRSFLTRLSRGEWIGANAITEGDAGSDVFSLRTQAVRDSGGYRLTGTKSYVSNGPIADVFVVYATLNPRFGYMGITAFVVERDRPGIAVGAPFRKAGLTTAPTASVYLDDCVVPAENRLGADGQGGRVFQRSMNWERACLFASYVGMMDRQLDQVVAYAKERKQFGRAIGKNQAVSHRIVDMKLRLEAARWTLYRACCELDRGQDASATISMAKLMVSEAARQSSLDAIQIFGGIGLSPELGLDRMLRDSLPSTLFSGTSEIQRELIARAMGL